MRLIARSKGLIAALAIGSACLLYAVMASSLQAQPPRAVNFIAAGRTITGMVTDNNGKPAPNIPVRLTKRAKMSGPEPRDPNKNPAGDSVIGTPDASLLQKGPGNSSTLASTTTDSSGRFTFPNVQPGEYGVIAGTPQAAGRANVKVEADKDPAAVTIQLKKATQ